jgi:6,7-dimethyl-8-ribityllumazine synthase
MTSFDSTRLPAEAKGEVAARVGQVFDGSVSLSGGDRQLAAGGHAWRIAFACAEFNGGITYRLLTGALDALAASGGDPGGTMVAWVPGAFELPLVAQRLVEDHAVDAVVCLGAVIRGETGHYDFVAGECAAGLQRVQLDSHTPVVFGVLTTDTLEQALERSEPDHANKGREAVLSALSAASVLSSVTSSSGGSRVGFSVGRR